MFAAVGLPLKLNEATAGREATAARVGLRRWVVGVEFILVSSSEVRELGEPA